LPLLSPGEIKFPNPNDPDDYGDPSAVYACWLAIVLGLFVWALIGNGAI